MSESTKDEICCPVFVPAPWDRQTFTWTNKRFLKTSVCAVWYMPLGFGRAMTSLFTATKAAGVATPENLCLVDHRSPWSMDIYLAVEGEVPGFESVSMSGSYLSKVYEGQYKEMGKWMADFAGYAKERGAHLARTFAWYTTCPKCAKKHGHNYVVLIGEVKQ